MKISEVASSATGYQDLLRDALGPFKHRNASAAFAGFDRAHQSGSTGSKNDCIELMGHEALKATTFDSSD